MNKKLVFSLFFLLSVLLLGCTDLTENAYQIWRNSEEAEDLNGDRKIDEADYEIYLSGSAYDLWKESEEAEDLNDDRSIDEDDYELYLKQVAYELWRVSDESEDLNGDRKIDEADYELYLDPPLSEYEIWLDSEDAEDLNDDGSIDEDDYNLFIEDNEFTGSYSLSNYTYEGSPRKYIGDHLYLTDLGEYLSEITILVDNQGNVSANIPSATIASLKDKFALVLELLENMELTRLSPFLVGLDTIVTIDEVEVNVTLYFTAIENGFTTTYVLNNDDENGTITFDLIKEA